MNEVIRLPAIKIEQPIGTFYAVSFDSKLLKKVSFSTRAEYKRKDLLDGVFSLMSGTQRELNEKRSKQISQFIDTSEATFPNSIILGANIDKNGNYISDVDKRWRIEREGGNYFLLIPSDSKVATIIDGQHRLSGFDFSERENMQLLCSVFIDLPAPYQAYIFATININQKKVNKSLAYELYGFKLDDEPREKWSPEKLAVYIVRRLNAHHEALKNKVKLGATIEGSEFDGVISLSTLVDGILQLITSDPKSDRDLLLNISNKSGRSALKITSKNYPLRSYFISYNDEYIESVVSDFFTSLLEVILPAQNENSYLLRTIGYQALFSFLKIYLISNDGVFDMSSFKELLKKSINIDFSDSFFTASGIGATRIKNTLLIQAGLKALDQLSTHKDYTDYYRLNN